MKMIEKLEEYKDKLVTVYGRENNNYGTLVDFSEEWVEIYDSDEDEKYLIPMTKIEYIHLSNEDD